MLLLQEKSPFALLGLGRHIMPVFLASRHGVNVLSLMVTFLGKS